MEIYQFYLTTMGYAKLCTGTKKTKAFFEGDIACFQVGQTAVIPLCMLQITKSAVIPLYMLQITRSRGRKISADKLPSFAVWDKGEYHSRLGMILCRVIYF